jgi:putative hydrolase of the HAD superfamily
MPITAAIFDLDDTLYLERDYVRSGYAAVAEYLDKRAEKRGLRPISSAKSVSVPDFPGRQTWRQTTSPCHPYAQWLWSRFQRGQAAGAFDDLNSHFSLGLAKADITELVKVYREHRPTIRPIPGIPELLARLRPEFALGLLADGFLPAQRLKLAALGLERFFDAVVFTEDLGRDAWKPSPAGFEKIGMDPIFLGGTPKSAWGCPVVEGPTERHPQADLGVPQEFFAYISDNPSKDFLAPNRLGWRTIQWLYPGQVHAHLPAPEGGGPQFIARLPGEVIEILRH